jgi:Protein of unknown function (DUF993)
MTLTLTLPFEQDGKHILQPYTLATPRVFVSRAAGNFNRVIFSAAHVVAQPLATLDPWQDCSLDWEATIAYRVHLWNLGLGVAEAMDTAQRGMGLDWPTSLTLIRESIGAARGIPGARLASGCGTDQLLPEQTRSLDQVIAAYEEQMAAIEALGGRLILMASRALARIARGPEDYARVYDRLLGQTREPVILHWLGEMFDPALAGYWGHTDHAAAMAVALDVIRRNAARVDGIKISLLDKDHEIAMRRQLPAAVRMYTGDDFNYPELIAGDDAGYSHALLGIFDAIAPAAAVAMSALTRGDREEFHRILAPTVPLSRHMFSAPTRYYKTGVVFMAWLNGFQSHFTMIGGQQSARSITHLAELYRLADRAGLLADPPLACQRMRQLLSLHGVS